MFSTPAEAARRFASATSGFAGRTKGASNAFGHDAAGGGSSSKRTKRGSRRGDSNQNDSNGNGNGVGVGNGNANGNGAKQKLNRGQGERRDQEQADSRRSRRRRGPRKPPAQDENDPNRRPPSRSSSEGSFDCEPTNASPSNDPLAISIYETLNAQGICPPQWPSEPGDVKSQPEMSRFRDRYEAYRQKARVALIRAGLIDDPDKRKRLSDALEFKGICEDMCPDFEKITRITEHDVNRPERDPRTGIARVRMMVKKLARSAAGQEAPLPMDVRSAPALRRTLDYLIDVLLCRDKNLLTLHPFLWDRTRAIRRDFAFFSSMTEEEIKTQAYVLENITRFHVTSLHLLSRREKDDERFVEQQEVEQLGKTLLSLRDVYDDCNERGIQCDNEAEFRAYFLIFHGRDPSILDALQRQWQPRLWKDSDDVRTAVSLVEALQDTQEFIGSRKDGDAGPLLAASGAYLSFFRIVEDVKVSYTMACFAECHFAQLRRSMLSAVKRALGRPKDPVQDVTAAALNQFLLFDKVEQAIKFAQLHNLDFVPDPQDPADTARQLLVLKDKSPLPHVRLNHQFSQSLVERKRGLRPLPDLIHLTIFERTDTQQDVRNGNYGEESMFVEDDEESEEADFAPSSPEAAPAGPENPTNQPTSKNAATSFNGQRKVPPINNAFLIESDTEDDGSNGLAVPQQQQPAARANPFAPDFKSSAKLPLVDTVAPSPSSTKLPTFEEVKALDANNFFYDMPKPAFGQPGSGVAASNGSQSAKPNPFASRLQLPSLLAGNKSDNVATEKSTPLAPPAGLSIGGIYSTQNNPGISGPVSTSPLAEPVQLGSGLAVARSEESGISVAQPRLFNSASQSFGSRTHSCESPPHDLGQPKPTPNNSAAFSTAKTPSSLPANWGVSKAAESLAPTGSAQTTFATVQSAPEIASNQHNAPTTDGRDKSSFPSIPAASSSTAAFGSSTPSILESRGHTTAGKMQDTAGASLAAQSFGASDAGEKNLAPGVPGPILQPAALSDETTASAGSKATGPVTSTPASAPLSEANKEVAGPPRDLLGDFNQWYVKGDNGLLADFLVESIRSITESAFQKFKKETEEQKRREEEERTNAEIEKFRTYNLSVKFFYRWRRNARKKRLRAVRLKARDELRAYYAERHAAERKEEEKSDIHRETERVSAPAVSNKSEELINMMKAKESSKREARESLLASGILSGMNNEREAAERIVDDDTNSSYSSSDFTSKQSLESSAASAKKEGPKTRALRRLYFGQPERFRRSLPSMSSIIGDDAESTKRPNSNVSSRWRLKAMGIVPLPDGTAVPEILTNQMSGWLRYPRSVSPWRSRRVSATDAIESEMRRLTPPAREGLSMSPTGEATPANKRKRHVDDVQGLLKSGSTEKNASKRVMSEAERLHTAAAVETSPTNKRKRSAADDDQGSKKGNAEGDSHKRVVSNAEKLRLELKGLRAELEEGTEWFRTQNERFRSESEARTPWFDDSI